MGTSVAIIEDTPEINEETLIPDIKSLLFAKEIDFTRVSVLSSQNITKGETVYSAYSVAVFFKDPVIGNPVSAEEYESLLPITSRKLKEVLTEAGYIVL